MKIVTILGARPQFIKAGSVSREICRRSDGGENIKEIIIHTGQHYDANMSQIFFSEMQIPTPDYFLGIGGKSHGAMTGQMIEKIESILLQEKPDLVMVYGDTNSTLAGAIAASKLNIKIAHIEAGLRSFNMTMPEEVNRILTDRISHYLLCPTEAALNNLNNEGIVSWGNNVVASVTGDVMLDGAIFYKKLCQRPAAVNEVKDFVLCTIHRAENTDDPMKLASIFSALDEIAIEIPIVLPIHPRTRKKLFDMNLISESNRIKIIDPVGYLNMVWLINNCSLVMTDSGGLQKESYFFEKPCITLRDETEWVELVELGVNVLTGSNKDKILSAFEEYKDIGGSVFGTDLYGSGQASKKIIDMLLGSHYGR